MKLFIPDASILLKWVLPQQREPHVDEAVAIRDAFVAGQIQLLVPSLWFFEAGNVIALHYADSAAQRLGTLTDLSIPEAAPYRQWRDTSVGLVRKHKVSFYDASYHALAIVRQGIFVTADARYIRKTGSSGAIMALSDWPGVTA